MQSSLPSSCMWRLRPFLLSADLSSSQQVPLSLSVCPWGHVVCQHVCLLSPSFPECPKSPFLSFLLHCAYAIFSQASILPVRKSERPSSYSSERKGNCDVSARAAGRGDGRSKLMGLCNYPERKPGRARTKLGDACMGSSKHMQAQVRSRTSLRHMLMTASWRLFRRVVKWVKWKEKGGLKGELKIDGKTVGPE
mmetsp:Transcript_42531/g.83847  ORF Transcript_42531/g.83847 Transcript_42531/m.83847 type:complete len:194 (-) Transcript_42531:176-757(-)